MKKSIFLKKIAVARLKYEAALELVRADQMEIQGASGEMSVKDILGHVAWYEREMVNLLQDMALEGSDLWGKSAADRNASILAASRTRLPEEIQSETEDVYAHLIGLLERLPEGALTDPAQFRDMPPDWVPWQVIAGNTYEHYEDHANDILEWLDEK